jgi:hypothetical protein
MPTALLAMVGTLQRAHPTKFWIQFSNSNAVIVSAAKQSIFLSGAMDCFAALAMTVVINAYRA